MSIFAVAVQDGRLTFREIMADIPHDAGAVVVYGMFVLMIWFIWWGSRDKSSPEGPPSASDRSSAAPPSREEQRD